MKPVKLTLKILGATALLFTISLIGGYDYRIQAVVETIIYSLILINLKEEFKLRNYLILLTPIILIEGAVRIFYFEDTFFSLPPFIFKLLPFLLFIIFKSEKSKKIAFLFGFIMTVVLNVFFYDYWLNYCNEDTLTGKVQSEITYNFTLADYKQKKDTLTINENSGIKVIDFWAVTCGVCYKKFPKLKELKDNYVVNKNIQFVTALYTKDTVFTEAAYEIDSTYSFNTYIFNDSVRSKLSINSYPTIIVFNNDAVIFRGSVEMLKIYLESEAFEKITGQ